jgi:hypothetical protein
MFAHVRKDHSRRLHGWPMRTSCDASRRAKFSEVRSDMGAATRHRKAFLLVHRICAFCGGNTPATTIEHCPPRVMFQNKQWPEGFEFPACQACNQGSSNDDLLIGMLARMDPFEDKGNLDGRAPGILAGVHQQFPGIFGKMMAGAHPLGLPVAKVTDEMHDAVSVLARKLAKGIYWRDVGAFFPNDGGLMMTWYTNADVVRDGGHRLFESLKDIAGVVPRLVRSGKYLNDQFEYKLSISPDQTIIGLQARFGNGFGLIIFGSTSPGLLERNIQLAVSARPRGDGVEPFRILQSPTLPLGRLKTPSKAV